MNTLHLTLKKQWFDMILSGEKKEEYRALSNYWCNRFCDKNWQSFEIEIFIHCLNYSKLNFKTIVFTNGYGKNKPQIVVEYAGIDVREGNLKWGAEFGTTYFVIKIGKIIATKNIKI